MAHIEIINGKPEVVACIPQKFTMALENPEETLAFMRNRSSGLCDPASTRGQNPPLSRDSGQQFEEG